MIEHIPGHLRLRNVSCLIAGAGTDIAATVARVFAVEGCKIIAVDDDVLALRALSNVIEEEGGSSSYRQLNMTECSSLEDSLALQNLSYGQFDIVVDARFKECVKQGTDDDDLSPNLDPSLLHIMSKCSPADAELRNRPLQASSAFSRPRHFRVNTVCFRYRPQPVSVVPLYKEPARLYQLRSGASSNQRAFKLQIAQAALFFASEEAHLIDGASLFIDAKEAE